MAASSPPIPPARVKKAFTAIKMFVDELYEGFKEEETKTSPLLLYWRFLTLVEKNENLAGKTLICNGFYDFFKSYDKELFSNKTGDIPEGTRIYYPKQQGIYIDICKYLKPSPDDTHIIVRQHLMTISGILNPDEKKLKAIERSEKSNAVLAIPNDGSEESKFLSGIMEKAKSSMADIEVDGDNPTSAVMGLLQSGLVNDMMEGIQEGMGSGKFKYRKMARTMQALISSFIPEGDDDDSDEDAIQELD